MGLGWKNVPSARDTELYSFSPRNKKHRMGAIRQRALEAGFWKDTEKKRVCIAPEILTDPSILFFDEPMSGLDSTIALRIIDIAKSLSKNGITVVMEIHQPSSRLYVKFDKLMLLSEGHCTYLGQAQRAMNLDLNSSH
jgi:ABC-type cobalamin/Fe3+-siderophores transport system ATPase subunit